MHTPFFPNYSSATKNASFVSSGMFDPVVLLHARRVGQQHRILQRSQPIDQPIPVVGGFNADLFESLFVRQSAISRGDLPTEETAGTGENPFSRTTQTGRASWRPWAR